MSLHALVEKVSVFTQEDRAQLGDGQGAMCDLFTQYGALLANQGEMVTASKYISSQDNVSNELRHRLFYASQMDRSGAAHPPLPFEQIYVSCESLSEKAIVLSLLPLLLRFLSHSPVSILRSPQTFLF